MNELNKNTLTISTINDWIKLKNIFKNKQHRNNWVYRGQSDSDWHLQSTIDRWKIDDKFRGEKKLINRFIKDKSCSKILKSKFYYSLCYLQHYGVPTRLLDVTVNPFIACFFALSDCDSDKECSVFAINRKIFQTNSLSRLRYELNPNNSIKEIIDNREGNLENDSYLKLLIEANLSGIFAIKPSASFRRIARQEGGFLFQGNISKNFNDNITEVITSNYFNAIDDCYQKINISGELKDKILKELKNDFDIDNNYVYPDENKKFKNYKHVVELELQTQLPTMS